MKKIKQIKRLKTLLGDENKLNQEIRRIGFVKSKNIAYWLAYHRGKSGYEIGYKIISLIPRDSEVYKPLKVKNRSSYDYALLALREDLLKGILGTLTDNDQTPKKSKKAKKEVKTHPKGLFSYVKPTFKNWKSDMKKWVLSISRQSN